jgi:hypothetical protein
MGEVVVMPGVERLDLVGAELPAEHVLRAAITLSVYDIVIVGRHRTGARYVASSLPDMEKVLGILTDGVAFLTTGDFAQGIIEESAEPEEPT